jgi:hypothetical protein
MESEARLGPISESHRHHIREINSLQLPEGRSISQPFVGASKTWSWLNGTNQFSGVIGVSGSTKESTSSKRW